MTVETKKDTLPLAKVLLTLVLGFITLMLMLHVLTNPDFLLTKVFKVERPNARDIWNDHQTEFKEYSTTMLSPDFLASVALVEANPPQRSLASSASMRGGPSISLRRAGVLRLREELLAKGEKFCLNGGKAYRNGGFFDFGPCWTSNFKSKKSGGRSIEIASLALSTLTHSLLKRHDALNVELPKQQTVAAILHKCGASVADQYIANGFRAPKGLSCEGENMATYIRQIKNYQRSFARLQIAKN